MPPHHGQLDRMLLRCRQWAPLGRLHRQVLLERRVRVLDSEVGEPKVASKIFSKTARRMWNRVLLAIRAQQGIIRTMSTTMRTTPELTQKTHIQPGVLLSFLMPISAHRISDRLIGDLERHTDRAARMVTHSLHSG